MLMSESEHCLASRVTTPQATLFFQISLLDDELRFVLRSASNHGKLSCLADGRIADLEALPMDELEQHSVPYRPLSLRSIHRLCGMVHQASERGPDRGVTVGPFRTAKDMTNSALLVGAYLLLCQAVPLPTIVDMLGPVSPLFEWYDDADCSVIDALCALEHAKKITWIDFDANNFLRADSKELPNIPKLDMEEFSRHADKTQGSIHIVVPGKVFVFPEISLNSAEWTDNEKRRFSSAVYAELLQDLGCNVVIKDWQSVLNETAYEEKNIHIQDMDLRQGTHLLGQCNSLLHFAKHPGSVVAMQKCSDSDRTCTTLLVFLLIRQYAFPPGSSSAWLSMVLRS